MRRRWAPILVGCLAAYPGPALGDEPGDDKARAEAFLAVAREEAEAHALEDASGARLAFRPEPVLRWSNPVAGSIHGDVFVWTANGRPEAVGSFFKWYSPHTHRTNEFASLSTGPVVAVRDGARVWYPTRPGVAFKPIPGAPTPAATPNQRLRQIRLLAADFSARQTTRENIERDLRLLSQPIYRYDKPEGDLIDGALFTFVQGTDPEAFLLIEARRGKDGVPRWEYALARMNSIAIRVTCKGASVWEAPVLPWATVKSPSEPYTIYRFDDAKGNVPRNP